MYHFLINLKKKIPISFSANRNLQKSKINASVGIKIVGCTKNNCTYGKLSGKKFNRLAINVIVLQKNALLDYRTYLYDYIIIYIYFCFNFWPFATKVFSFYKPKNTIKCTNEWRMKNSLNLSCSQFVLLISCFIHQKESILNLTSRDYIVCYSENDCYDK